MWSLSTRLRLGRLSIIAACCVLFLALLEANGQVATLGSRTHLQPYADADAYAIYAVLLQDTKHSSFVILSETEWWSGATPRNLGIKGNRKFRKAWGGAMKDFAEKDHEQCLLTHDIPIDLSYQLISSRELAARAYPQFYYFFSAVGFDAGRTRAIVSMGYFCGGLCGHGSFHFLQKINGKWQEVSVDAETQVWFSQADGASSGQSVAASLPLRPQSPE